MNINKKMNKNKMFGGCACFECFFGVLLWIGSAASIVAAWMSRGEMLGIYEMDSLGWLLTAIALGVLAIPCLVRGAKCGDCSSCSGKGCNVCK